MRQSSVEIQNSFNPENDAWNFERLSIIQVVTFWILTAFNKILIQIELGCGKTLIYIMNIWILFYVDNKAQVDGGSGEERCHV